MLLKYMRKSKAKSKAKSKQKSKQKSKSRHGDKAGGLLIRFAGYIKATFTPSMIVGILAGTAITSFGVYNIHGQTGITEGGVIGLILLINHWTGFEASILSPLLDIASYAFAFRFLGKDFLAVSAVSTISLAGFYRLWESLPYMLPDLSAHPLIAAVAGGIFVGVGAGLIVRRGGAGAGDDALALAISKLTGWRIAFAYLLTDLTVLLLSLSYIPLRRISYSLLTVAISSPLVDLVQSLGAKKEGRGG